MIYLIYFFNNQLYNLFCRACMEVYIKEATSEAFICHTWLLNCCNSCSRSHNIT